MSTEPTPPARPQSIWSVIVLWLFAGLFGLFGAVSFFSQRDQRAEEAIRFNTDPAYTPDQVRAAAAEYSWTLLIGAIAFALLFSLFSYLIRPGARWVRNALVIVGVLNLLFEFSYGRFFSPGVFSMLCTVIGICVLFLPTVSRYFKAEPQSAR